MNRMNASDRAYRRLQRENFMLYHFCHFAECRRWTADGMITRLKAEGLLAKSTYRHDATSVARFWNELREVRL